MPTEISKYRYAKEALMGSSGYMSSDIKVAFMQEGFSLGTDAVSYLEVSGMEVAAQLYYPTGGVPLPGRRIETDAAGRLSFWCGAVRVQEITARMQYAVVYLNEPSASANKPLIFAIDFKNVLEFSNSLFIMSWAAPILRW